MWRYYLLFNQAEAEEAVAAIVLDKKGVQIGQVAVLLFMSIVVFFMTRIDNIIIIGVIALMCILVISRASQQCQG